MRNQYNTEYQEVKESLSDIWCKLDEILNVLKDINKSQINLIHEKVLEVLNSELNPKRRKKHGSS